MNGEVAYSGSLGSNYRLRLTVTLLSQDPINNRSLVRVQADMRRLTSANFVFNLNATSGSITYDGTNASRTMSSYDFRSSNGPFYFTESFTDVYINHNADGTKTANFQAYHNAANSPYVTTATVSFNYTLPTIARNATLTQFTATPITDEGWTFNVGTDVTCDLLEYSLNDGGAYTTAFTGDFTSKTIAITNQTSATAFTTRVRVRRKDSGLKTTSNALVVTTLAQNNFKGFL
jgi:hypothetical protein